MNSNSFKFISVFENEKTINREPFLREVIFYDSLNNTNGKNIAVVYASDFMLNRMAASKHIHIDATFVHPPNFIQILIILYIDVINNIRAPGAFIIMNRKTQDLYERVFKSIKYCLTYNKTKIINIKTATIDFEIALKNAFHLIFPEIKIIACLFHYKQALIKRLRILGLYKNKYKENSDYILKLCGELPFKIHYDNNAFNNCLTEINKYKGFSEFSLYFEEEWSKYIKINEILDYHRASKSFRSNSFIENYNRRVKEILGKYYLLINNVFINLGVKKLKQWPTLISFFKNENEWFKQNLSFIENKNNSKNFNNINRYDNIKDNNNQKKKYFFFCNKFYSCWVDCYLFFVFYLLYPEINNSLLEKDEKIDYILNICNIIACSSENDFLNGIWILFDKYNVDTTKLFPRVEMKKKNGKSLCII